MNWKVNIMIQVKIMTKKFGYYDILSWKYDILSQDFDLKSQYYDLSQNYDTKCQLLWHTKLKVSLKKS